MSSSDDADLDTGAPEQRTAEATATSSPEHTGVAATENNEEEDVAYDEEPDEAEAAAPSDVEQEEQDEQAREIHTYLFFILVCP